MSTEATGVNGGDNGGTQEQLASILPPDVNKETGTDGQSTNGTAAAQPTEGVPGAQGAQDKQTVGGTAQGQTGQEADYGGLTVPEGYTLDADAMAEFTPILNEIKATPEVAQKLIDMHVAHMEKLSQGIIKAEQDVARAWSNELRNDPEIGGTKLDENLAIGAKILQKYGSPELIKALDEFHLGNYPPMVKFILAMAKDVRQDTMLDIGSNVPGADDSTEAKAKRMFPNSYK